MYDDGLYKRSEDFSRESESRDCVQLLKKIEEKGNGQEKTGVAGDELVQLPPPLIGCCRSPWRSIFDRI